MKEHLAKRLWALHAHFWPAEDPPDPDEHCPTWDDLPEEAPPDDVSKEWFRGIAEKLLAELGQTQRNVYEWEGFGCLAENEEQARELIREQVAAGNFVEGYDPSDDPVERVYTEPSFVLYTC